MTEAAAAARYLAAPGVRFRLLDDDDALVFNPFSWETHLLNPAAALVLEMTTEAARSEDDIRETLAEVLDAAERSQAPAYARRLLRELLDLRLLTSSRA